MNSALNAYKKNQVQTISQEKLVLMLYDGAVKFTLNAIEALDDKDISRANENFIRCQDIILELMSGINWETGELAQSFYTIYEYMHHSLMQANIKKDKQIAVEVCGMARELRDVWSQMLGEAQGTKDYSTQKRNLSISG
ncbi:flagellar export chaperone FliS [Metallumcola ferriviriculae]|uniref:Flagellar secretion chaperone FliS n=1 Tax=Metallumcola ferriviriculae TaxID=3039180 RepID=A0AAU0UT56_9FIRM|nr:flagellar export chaperone FliS [Desulfitibacteraceae bacterium MK1]